MSTTDGFHPDLTARASEGTASLRTRVHHVRAGELDSDTARLRKLLPQTTASEGRD